MDRDTFLHWILALSERHQRELTPTVVRLYFEALADEMETEEFAAAAARLFATGDRFPSPQDFLDASPLAAKDRAVAHKLFDRLFDKVTGYWEPRTTNEQKSHWIDATFGTNALVAFQATGGFDRWLTVFRANDERQKEWLRKEWLEAREGEEHSARARRLASAPAVQALARGTRPDLLAPAEELQLGSGR